MNQVMIGVVHNELGFHRSTELFILMVSLLVQAATTNYHGLDGLNNKHLFLTELEAGSPRSGCQHA